MQFICLLLSLALSCEALLAGVARSPKTAVPRLKSVPTDARRRTSTSVHLNNINNENDKDINYDSMNRRKMISSLITATVSTTGVIGGLVLGGPMLAANAINLKLSPEDPTITHKVIFNIRISRADGTFYTRDDPEPPTPDNQVFTGDIALGLYGDLAPNHVEKFLNYVDVKYSPADDSPLPSYARSQFPSLDQSTGLLAAGYIPGLHLTSFAGSTALEYGGRILSTKLWADDFLSKKKTLHYRPGLLTHRDLDVLPNFGITTRSAMELNTGNTVFGSLLPTESSIAFLSRCADLPTYSLDRPALPIGEEQRSRAAEEVATSVYSFQKNLFRSAAQTFGDTRLGSVYEGKILRRIEVTSVSFEKM